jgi:hypothetical protein
VSFDELTLSNIKQGDWGNGWKLSSKVIADEQALLHMKTEGKNSEENMGWNAYPVLGNENLILFSI